MLKNISIKRKLLLINLAVAGLALVLVGGVVLLDQYRGMKAALLDDLQLQARIIANNSTAALTFDDHKVGAEIIGALKFSPAVRYAAIRDEKGEIFAEYRAGLISAGTDYEAMSEPVAINGEVVGSVEIKSDLAPLRSYLERQAAVVAMVLTAVFAIVWWLLAQLNRTITKPLWELTQLMRLVSDNKAYSLRARASGNDEVGSLAHGFNDMLEQIQRRDEALEEHKLGLERLVGKRTEQLEHMASHDALTGLPNRQLLMDRLSQAIYLAERSNTMVALLFIDLDHFKELNDTLGHAAGDQLLREISSRELASLRKGDTVARFGGDEFVVVLGNLERPSDIEPEVMRILAAVAQPVRLGTEEVEMGASIGISIYPQDGNSGELLLRNADIAMYRAKELGRNNYQFYTEELNARLVERKTLLAELRHAIDAGGFVLHYQPQLDLTTGHIVAMEALLRWQHPKRGLLSPAHFITLAEESGLIVPIGAWVLGEACRQASAWHAAGLPRVRVAVNLAVRQVAEEDLEQVVQSSLQRCGLAGEYLELELTETDVMHNPEAMVDKFQRLRAMGISIALDDFGMGYSSLSYLKRFSFDRLKIDQSFVRDIVSDPEDAAITRTIIAIARSLGMEVIAEGVETEAALGYLKRHGCNEIQGYLISRPLPAPEAEALLRANMEAPQKYALVQNEPDTLLLLDDDANTLKSLQRMLHQENYQVLATTSAAEAFDLLAQHQVQVLVADQRMPEMNGTEFLVRVKELYPETVRIMYTAYPEATVITQALNQGAIYKFLVKPLDDSVLRHEIAGAFELYKQQHFQDHATT